MEWDKTKAMRKIITSQDCPPIPVRDYDWSALREDYDEGDFIGYGRTEQDAIDDLKRQENEC
jgi:hypothetical protein